MPETDRLKTLLLGSGGIARKHLKALRSLEPNAVVGAFRRTGTSRPEGIDEVFTHWDQAVRFGPNSALICSPTNLHVLDMRQVATLKIPFLVEKPVADRDERLAELAESIESKSIPTYVGCPLRFDPMIRSVREKLVSGEWKRPQRVRIDCHSYLPSWRPERDYRKTYSADKERGGGVGLDLIHEFDTLFWWFGLPQKISGFRTQVSPLDIRSDDQLSAVLLYPRMVAEVSLSYGEQNERRRFELTWSDQVFEGDLLTGELWRITPGHRELQQRFERDREALFLSQMQHFLQIVCGKEKSLHPLQEGIRTLQAVLKIESP